MADVDQLEERSDSELNREPSLTVQTLLGRDDVDLNGKTVLGSGCVFKKGGVHYSRKLDSVAFRALQATLNLSQKENWYQSPWFLTNGHTHTIWGALARRSTSVKYKRELLPTPDGGTLALDHLEPSPDSMREGPERWLVLFTGLCGNSEDTYIQSCARAAAGRGWRVTVMNGRGCGTH
eukprot:CAMPEP_0118954244 /NCGR_PEP_ID=MMETSP1169-20130426/57906_1 /TAXON_ID=36882 /ORGANISM="Pyramimonas obovata, Strain CCMP722" /LENGTH=178 /DNA_ID=CAMNT_0006901841 /DNA_START=198 /DNA_END=731 /DNA_ORIENTATION=+